MAKDPQLEQRIKTLLASMTLEQKVAQMVQPDIRSVTPEDVRRYRLGSILNGGGAFPDNRKNSGLRDWVALADRYYEASMDTSGGAPAIPVLWGTDAVHGHNNVIGATLFPHNIGLGAMRDPDLIEKIGAATAREVAASGIDWAFAPTVATVRDDRWGRTYEGYSEDPEIVRSYAGRMVQGLQGTAGTQRISRFVARTGHRQTLHRRRRHARRRGPWRQRRRASGSCCDIHGQGYITALGAGVQTVMVSYNSWQGWKLHGHKYLITDVLKNRMGFDGLVVSDWNGIDEVQGCPKDKCAAAVNAGIDVLMVPEDWKSFLAQTIAQVKNGEIPQERIDDAVTRILRVKFRAGLFNERPAIPASARQRWRNAGRACTSRHRAAGGARVAGAAQESRAACCRSIPRRKSWLQAMRPMTSASSPAAGPSAGRARATPMPTFPAQPLSTPAYAMRLRRPAARPS